MTSKMRILMLGLDNTGKTTILNKISCSQDVEKPSPSTEFKTEHVEYKGKHFSICDAGGQEKLRLLWKDYFADTHGIIFVINSIDKHRIDEARDELVKLLNANELKNVPLLVIANKQDLPDVLHVNEIKEQFGLGNIDDRKWGVLGVSATKDADLLKILDWFSNEHKNN